MPAFSGSGSSHTYVQQSSSVANHKGTTQVPKAVGVASARGATIPPGTWSLPASSPRVASAISPQMWKVAHNIHIIAAVLRRSNSSLQSCLQDMVMNKLDHMIPARVVHNPKQSAQTPKKAPVRISLMDTIQETPQEVPTAVTPQPPNAAVMSLVSLQVAPMMTMETEAQTSLESFVEQRMLQALNMVTPAFSPTASVMAAPSAVAPDAAALGARLLQVVGASPMICAPPAGARYRCLNSCCGGAFAKWSACCHHINSNPSCKAVASAFSDEELHADSLQQRCKV